MWCKEYVLRNNKFALTYCKTWQLYSKNVNSTTWYVILYVGERIVPFYWRLWKHTTLTFMIPSFPTHKRISLQYNFACTNYALTYPLTTERRMSRNYNRVLMPKREVETKKSFLLSYIVNVYDISFYECSVENTLPCIIRTRSNSSSIYCTNNPSKMKASYNI